MASDKLIPGETRATFETIGKHEAAHVEVHASSIRKYFLRAKLIDSVFWKPKAIVGKSSILTADMKCADHQNQRQTASWPNDNPLLRDCLKRPIMIALYEKEQT